ncbi:MAG TPA: T9SS type A sorting domain-containing protein [Candidatus Deferrimicrobium sp.]|nr:T9SS type A sorting domain-containing protein [Candidatus Deferrimicrobium sp.]
MKQAISRCPRLLLLTPLLVIAIAMCAAAQNPVPGVGASKFGIEGNLLSNSPSTAPFNTADDWVQGPAGPGAYVLNNAGVPLNPDSAVHAIDQTNAGGDKDSTVFTVDVKVFQDPNTFNWKLGDIPQKDDIQHGLVHWRTRDDSLWFVLAGDRRATNGDSYIDFELLQAPLYRTYLNDDPTATKGAFISEGLHGGRTIGDLVVTIHLVRGGAQAEFFLQRWDSVPGEPGEFTYFDVTPVPESLAFVSANVDSQVYVPYGAFGSNYYEINAFGETSINITGLIEDLGECFGISTVFIRTKSSQSADAELKDFIEPIQLHLCLDKVPPVLSGCPDDITIECDDPVPPPADVTATDECDSDVSISFREDTVAGACPQEYTLIRTWTATDLCDNSDSCKQRIYVVDTTPPDITCPPDIVFNCAMGNAGVATATDNCDPDPDVDYSDAIVSSRCPIVIERTWTATDACENSSNCVQRITIQDTTKPVITCPPDIVFDCAMGNAGVATATDNCDPDPDVDYSDEVTHSRCPVIIQRTWTATDSCDNVSSCIQTITIQDTTKPVISCPPDTVVDCGDGDLGTATATDNCDPDPDIDYSDVITHARCPIIIERTWTATDSCDNISSCVQTITIRDITPPVITCPPNIVFDCQMGNAGVATATDNCDPSPDIGSSDVVVNARCPIIIDRTWTATDTCGNTSSCVQRITIRDITPPVITCPPNVVFDCQMGDAGVATATDNCDPSPDIGSSDVVVNARCPIIIDRTWTATDTCGNTSSCVQRITICDITPPVITCPPNVVFDCQMGDAGVATATDNCDPSPDIGYSDVVTHARCPIIIARTWTATDTCSNVASCVQTITIQDTTKPVITCPVDKVFDCDNIGAFGTASATDNCDPSPDIMYGDVVTPGDCPAESTITRTWTATDTCGNTSSCKQVIRIQDTTRPTITCVPDDTIECDAPVVFTPPTADDNCDPSPNIVMVSESTTEGPGVGEFTHTRCWAAVDDCGNVSDTCCQDIIELACPEPCTFTMGGWGSRCPDPQDDNLLSTQPGCIRDHYFTQVFPSGVIIGDPAGPGGGQPNWYAAKWTTSAAVENYLPAGGTPGKLTADLTNPTSTPAGVLAGQILALTLNVEYSCAGIFTILGVPNAGSCYGAFVIPAGCGNGKFNGITVDSFLVIANKAVGGKTNVLNPFGATLSDVNFTATCLNELHDGCDPFPWPPPGVAAAKDEEGATAAFASTEPAEKAAEEQLPTEYSLSQNYPNPFNPTTDITFALPQASFVKLEIFNVLGQKVTTLVEGTREAGRHTVEWNASNVGSGVYLYRLAAGDFVETRKMMLLK